MSWARLLQGRRDAARKSSSLSCLNVESMTLKTQLTKSECNKPASCMNVVQV